MRRLWVPLLLAVAGGYFLHEGWVAAHSVAGTVDYYSKGILYKLLGRVRLPGYALTFLGGLLLVAAAWWLLSGKGRSGRRR